MQGPTQQWEQPPDPRESTVSMPRIDPSRLTDQVSESATAAYDVSAGLDLPGFGDPYARPARAAGPAPAAVHAPVPMPEPSDTPEPADTPELAAVPEPAAARLLEPELPPPTSAPEPAQPREHVAPPTPGHAAAVSRGTTGQPPRRAIRRPAPAVTDTPSPGSIAELRARLERLPDGHPSSPYDDDGWLKPLPTRLRQLELGLPARSLGTPAGYAERFGIDPDDDWLNDGLPWTTAAGPRPQPSNRADEPPGAAEPPAQAAQAAADAAAGVGLGSSEPSHAAAPARLTEDLLVTPPAGDPDQATQPAGEPDQATQTAEDPDQATQPAEETAQATQTAEDPDQATQPAGETAAATQQAGTAARATRPAAANGRTVPGDSGDGRLPTPRGTTTARNPRPQLQHPYASSSADHDPSDNGSPAGELVLTRWPVDSTAADRRSETAGRRNGHRPAARQPAADRPEPVGADRERRRPDPGRAGLPQRGDGATAGRPRLAPEHRDLVDRVLAAYRAAEGRNARGGYGASGLTPALRRIADQLPAGGLAPGSEADTLKPADRFAARLVRLIDRQPGRPPAELAATISDGARYAFVFPAADYTDGTLLVHRKLKTQGFDLEARRNQWDSREYKGIFTRWRDPAHGLAFEVQFHTVESWAMVKQTHDAYLRITDPATPPAERTRLRARMAAAAATVGPPPGCLDVTDFRAGAR